MPAYPYYTYGVKNRPLSSMVGNAIGIAIAVYLCVLLAGTVKKNYDLSQQINTMTQQIQQLQSQKSQLAFEVQYYQTDSYRQKQAKANLGLVVPGESEIILPTPSATPAPTTDTSKSKQSNQQQWLNFIMGKG